MNLKQLMAFAKRNGYNGAEDFAAIKSYLSGKFPGKAIQSTDKSLTLRVDNLKLNADGTIGQADADEDLDFAISEEKVEATKSLDTTITPADVETLVTEAVTKALAAAGKADKAARPGNPGADVSVGLTGAERRYEDRKKSGQAVFDSVHQAEAFAAHLVLKSHPDRSNKLVKSCLDIAKKYAEKTYTTTPGSVEVLTGTEFYGPIIRLVDQFGVAAQEASVHETSEAEWVRFRCTTETLTVAYPLEGSAQTSQEEAWSRVVVRPVMGCLLTKWSKQTQLNSMVSLADETAQTYARSFAYSEDNMVFNGTGTAAQGGQIGLAGAFTQDGLALSTATGAVNANLAGTGAAAWGDYTLGHFQVVKSRLLASVAAAGRAKWYCTKAFFESVPMALARAAGGVTANEIANFTTQMFLGDPVVFTEVMNRTSAASANTIDCFYGDLSQACDLVRRDGFTFETSDQRYFDEFAYAGRGAMMHGISTRGRLGGLSASNQKAGAMIALYQS